MPEKEMKVGDKAQYNKKYKSTEIVQILKIDGNHALIEFPSGTKIVTNLNGLWPLTNKEI